MCDHDHSDGDQNSQLLDAAERGLAGSGWPRVTGKTGKVLTFSRQGKHREFCFDTGKNFETQGKYFSVTQGKI